MPTAGLEPTTSWSEAKRSIQLSYKGIIAGTQLLGNYRPSFKKYQEGGGSDPSLIRLRFLMPIFCFAFGSHRRWCEMLHKNVFSHVVRIISDAVHKFILSLLRLTGLACHCKKVLLLKETINICHFEMRYSD